MIRHYVYMHLRCEAVGLRCTGCSRSPQTLIPEQQIWFGDVRADTVARESLEGEGEGHGEVLWAGGVFADAKAEGSGPTAHVAIDCVGLFLEATIASFEAVKRPEAPVFVEAEVDGAVEKVVALPKRGWPSGGVIAQVEMSKADAPNIVGMQGDGVKGHAPMG